MVEKKPVGKITHYFSKPGAAVIELSDTLIEGDRIAIQGATTDIIQEVRSMEIDHRPVERAEGGSAVGLKVKDRVREGDEVFKVSE
ncbi:MAG: translation elongation factor-like protein [Methanomassiliicoccales archaeon]